MPRKRKFDPQSLIADIDHRDDALLAMIAEADRIHDTFDTAKARGETAYARALTKHGPRHVALNQAICEKPAYTREGILQKAELALRTGPKGDPDQPSGGYKGVYATAFSALFDMLSTGHF